MYDVSLTLVVHGAGTDPHCVCNIFAIARRMSRVFVSRGFERGRSQGSSIPILSNKAAKTAGLSLTDLKVEELMARTSLKRSITV
jgi:hypothetical protein